MNPADLKRCVALYRLARSTGASAHEQLRASEALARLCHRHRITVDDFERKHMLRVLRVPTTTYTDGLCAAIACHVVGLRGTALPLYHGGSIIYRGPPDLIRAAERLRKRLLSIRLPPTIINDDGEDVDISTTDDFRLGFFADLYQDIAIAQRTQQAATPRSEQAPPPPTQPTTETPADAPAPPPPQPAEDPTPAQTPDPPPREPYNLDRARRGYSDKTSRFRILHAAMADSTPIPAGQRLTGPRRAVFSYSYIGGAF